MINNNSVPQIMILSSSSFGSLAKSRKVKDNEGLSKVYFCILI
jgi:hypothetical protein